MLVIALKKNKWSLHILRWVSYSHFLLAMAPLVPAKLMWRWEDVDVAMPQLMSPAPSTSSPCCRCRWIAVQRPEQLIDKSVIWTGTVAVGRPNLVIASSWKQLCPTAPCQQREHMMHAIGSVRLCWKNKLKYCSGWFVWKKNIILTKKISWKKYGL
jgi:hypothetical protein